MYDSIMDALRRGAVAEALSEARALADAHPQDAQAHRLLSAALRQNGEAEAALVSIEQAIALAPDDASLHVERAGLLIGSRQVDAAQAALAQAAGLDPNQFPAYVLQAQLALGRGDTDEADRLSRLAGRIAPEHPHVAAIEGTVALRRGDADKALKILSAASQRWPEEPMLLYSLGFAYMQQGHLAFAEQAFRGVLEKVPDARALRGLIAELLRRQARPADAADELAPLLDDKATPGMRRFAGELELAAARPERALPLLSAALQAQPRDRRSLLATLEAWRQLGQIEEARHTLDTLLQTHADEADLWRARLAVEAFGSSEAYTVAQRWHATMPDSISALEAMAALHDQAGEHDDAEALLQRVVELEPGRTGAELRLFSGLLSRNPIAAIERVEGLLTKAEQPAAKTVLSAWLATAQDRAGRSADAVSTWSTAQAEIAPQRLPRPELSSPLRSDWPALAPLPDPAPGVVFLCGTPGSGVERLATVFGVAGGPFRADRFGPNPPKDGLQSYHTSKQLIDGELEPAALAQQWRDALPARGINDGQLIDWLLWWDNAWLLALRPHVPEGVLMIALRDPRDMLLDWLAFGSPMPFAIESTQAAATWLAITLNQIAVLHEQDLYPHRLIRLDEIMDDPQALATAIGNALEITMPAPPQRALGDKRFAAGRWRDYAEALAEPFKLLTPVARRLGYPET